MNRKVWQECWELCLNYNNNLLSDSQFSQISQHVKNMTICGHKSVPGGTFIYYFYYYCLSLETYISLLFKNYYNSVRRSGFRSALQTSLLLFTSLLVHIFSYDLKSTTLRLLQECIKLCHNFLWFHDYNFKCMTNFYNIELN